MIRTHRPPRAAAAGLLLATGLLAAASWWAWGPPRFDGPALEPADAAHAAPAASAAGSTGTMALRPETPPSEWAAMQQVVAERAQPPEQARRLAAYMRFQQAHARWQDLQDTPHVAQRQAAAHEVLALLPERLTQHDVSEADALAALAQLARDAQPDPVLRAALFDEQRLRLRAALAAPTH